MIPFDSEHAGRAKEKNCFGVSGWLLQSVKILCFLHTRLVMLDARHVGGAVMIWALVGSIRLVGLVRKLPARNIDRDEHCKAKEASQPSKLEAKNTV